MKPGLRRGASIAQRLVGAARIALHLPGSSRRAGRSAGKAQAIALAPMVAPITLAWLEKNRSSIQFKSHLIGLDQVRDWSRDEHGNIRHRSGHFFGIEGARVETDVREVISWDQPIMTQSDGGLLGMLARETPENRRPIPPRGRASGQGQSGRRSLRGTRGGDFFGGGRSKSAGTRKRARRRGTIAMLSPFLPRITSLTRLGVPSNGMRSARVRPC